MAATQNYRLAWHWISPPERGNELSPPNHSMDRQPFGKFARPWHDLVALVDCIGPLWLSVVLLAG